MWTPELSCNVVAQWRPPPKTKKNCDGSIETANNPGVGSRCAQEFGAARIIAGMLDIESIRSVPMAFYTS